MSQQIALERIAEAQRTRAITLDLLNLDLSTIPAELGKLTKLQTLDLSFNDALSDLSPLANLKKLTHLHLDYNQISDLNPLANLNNLTQLDLRHNQISDLNPLANLNKLTRLDLRHNQISDLNPLANLDKLTRLDLRHNQISDLNPLANLDKLTRLDLDHNQIDDLSTLAKLDNLTQLYLDDNQISDLNPLDNLNKLTRLDLRHNQISDLNPLDNLNNLTRLDLDHNRISDLNPLANLDKLTQLYLHHNQISDLNPLANLNKLTQLYLRHNQISDLNPLANLNKLTQLDLDHNQISDLNPLTGLTHLKTLWLSDNPIHSIRPLRALFDQGKRISLKSLSLVRVLFDQGKQIPLESLGFDDTIYAGGCPIQDPPLDILRLQDSHAAMLRFFALTDDGDTRPIHEAKLILVGEPGAGKTTLANKLLDPNYPVPKDEDSTLGITVHDNWSFPLPDSADTRFRAPIWDFGGQEIQYMTHQFFLTPSALYVLVADDRAQLTRFPYWFKIIHLLGQESGFPSPVLVVLNQKNQSRGTNFDLNSYQKLYPNLQIEQLTVNFADSNPHSLQQIKHAIQTHLPKLRHVGDQVPRAWLDIRHTLQARANTENHITWTTFQQICTEHGVVHEQDQLLISRYFHRLGNLLHFQQGHNLGDFVVLNPKWVVDAVYAVLKSEQVLNQSGRFSQDDLAQIWQGEYEYVEQSHLCNLMTQDHFEICYPVGANQYIAPQLLPNIQPEYGWPEQDCLRFRFRYAFMPKGIITRLIVRLHRLLATEQSVWQKGMILADQGCQARVLEDDNNPDGLRVIDIAVTGDLRERKFLLRKIRDEVMDIHQQWFSQISVEQMVPCCCSECIKASQPFLFELSTLENFLNKRADSIQCYDSGKQVPVLGLLEGVFDELPPNLQRAAQGAPNGATVPAQIHINIDNSANNANTQHTTQTPAAPTTLTGQMVSTGFKAVDKVVDKLISSP